MASTVLVHAIAAITRASNLLAAGIGVFAASLRYAKIAPATLHRGVFDGRCLEHAEAAGPMPKSGLWDFVRGIAGPAARIVQACSMARS
jgi:hypothetical protein